jgi:hypothetical protein
MITINARKLWIMSLIALVLLERGRKELNQFAMLDKCLMCIKVMTGDSMFYEQNREKILKIICNWDQNNINY